ncbi:phage tail spike protein [Clostridium perfringens]|uniref:phage tail spike protein n=1 Tax=Clostridium perfringens TaxID=1502 RepID=UPI00016BD78A|nr:phage tail spike protein [Clostridium perfringens]EDT26053.1 putative phage endopeptidase [Clostridium perfringens CPE str. F4969]
MINIYDSTETKFSHNGICSLDEKRELIKCTIHRKLEGAYEGTLFISKENLKWTEFIEGRILKLPVDINGRTQLFRIFDTSDDFTDLEVYFKHIFFDLDDFFIEDTNIVEKDGRGAINQILNTTVDSHRFTATSDINIINNCRIVDKTVTEAIGVDENCFLNRWGGEIDYDNFKFKINEKIGSDNGYRISLRKNLKAINGDISITEVATKLKIKGYDGIKLDEYLISPLANAYPHFKTRVVKFDDIKVKSDPDNPEEEGYETLQAAQLEMRRRGLELFSKQNIDKPTVNFEIDIDEMREENIEVGVLEVLSIGDIATLELEDFLRNNIEVKQRVIELEFDCIRKINIKVILGESTSTIFKEVSKIESILNDLNDKLEGNSWQDILDKSMEQATDIIAEGFKDSYVIPRKNEIIVADNIDLNLAKKVIVINKNGIGFSLEGYRPDRLTLAMTIDGEINASCIKFGSLSGALIDVGTIEADRLTVEAKKTIRDGLVSETVFDVFSDGIKAEINQKATLNNIVRNGDFKGGTLHWWGDQTEEWFYWDVYESYESYGFGGRNVLSLKNVHYYNTDKRTYSSKCYKVEENTDYTLNLHYCVEKNIQECRVYVILSNTLEGTYEKVYTALIASGGQKSDLENNVPHSFKFNTSQYKYVWISFNNLGMRQGSNWQEHHWFMISDVAIYRGNIGAIPFIPHKDELYSNTVKIDIDQIGCEFENGGYNKVSRKGNRWYAPGMEYPYHFLSHHEAVSITTDGTDNYTIRDIKLPARFDYVNTNEISVTASLKGWYKYLNQIFSVESISVSTSGVYRNSNGTYARIAAKGHIRRSNDFGSEGLQVNATLHVTA